MSWRDDVIAAVDGRRQSSDQRYVRVNCPRCPEVIGKFDREQSISVDLARGWWKCWRCGWRNRLPGFSDDVDDTEEGWEDVVPELEQPSAYVPVADANGWRASPLAAAGVRYLQGRHVSPQVAHAAAAGYAHTGDHAGMVVLPIPGTGADWIGWVARAAVAGARHRHYVAKGMPRRRLFWNDAALAAETDNPLVIVEGPFDALRLWPHAAACLGKPTREQIDRLMGVKRPLVIMGDTDATLRDKPFYVAAQVIRTVRPCGVVILPADTDPDEMGIADPDGVQAAIRQAAGGAVLQW